MVLQDISVVIHPCPSIPANGLVLSSHQTRSFISQVIKNQHLLLVTLLLCNAGASEALPLFLDRLADPISAVLISVTVVLIFGEDLSRQDA